LGFFGLAFDLVFRAILTSEVMAWLTPGVVEEYWV
jgi:hypothetical protein